MEIQISQQKQFVKTRWSGGTTTQLLLEPPDGNFPARDFKLRISCARVNGGSSDFTTLSGIHRKLLWLEGSLLLTRRKGYQLLLPGDHISFNGSERIQCKGSGADFNVMWKGKAKVAVQMLDLGKKDWVMLDHSKFHQKVFLYNHSGETEIRIGPKKFVLKAGMTLYIPSMDFEVEIFLHGLKKSRLVLAEILPLS